MLPLLPTIRPFVFSHDATHSSGTHPFGIKIDAIPGRFNFTSTIRTLIKGEHRGFRYELRGHGHSSTPIVGMIVPPLYLLDLYLFRLGRYSFDCLCLSSPCTPN